MTEQEKGKVVNHFLTLYIGECYHDEHSIYEYRGSGYDYNQCSICGKMWLINDPIPNPDFYTPNDFDRLRKWMEENEAYLLERYLSFIAKVKIYDVQKKNRSNDKWYIEIFNLQNNPSNLYEFLIEHRADWEWVKCPQYAGQGGFMAVEAEQSEMCRVCEGKGKVQHKAAVYLDSLEASDD